MHLHAIYLQAKLDMEMITHTGGRANLYPSVATEIDKFHTQIRRIADILRPHFASLAPLERTPPFSQPTPAATSTPIKQTTSKIETPKRVPSTGKRTREKEALLDEVKLFPTKNRKGSPPRRFTVMPQEANAALMASFAAAEVAKRFPIIPEAADISPKRVVEVKGEAEALSQTPSRRVGLRRTTERNYRPIHLQFQPKDKTAGVEAQGAVKETSFLVE